jgi:hypothetical protein
MKWQNHRMHLSIFERVLLVVFAIASFVLAWRHESVSLARHEGKSALVWVLGTAGLFALSCAFTRDIKPEDH